MALLDHAALTEKYQGRRNKRGRKIHRWWWYRQQPDNSFIVFQLHKPWAQDPKTQKWASAPKDQWTEEIIFQIWPERMTIFFSKITTSQSFQMLLNKFGLSYHRPNTIKIKGWDIHMDDGQHSWRWPSIGVYDGDVTIDLENRTASGTESAKVRTFDKDKQRGINATIRLIRRDFKIRARLGALENSTMIMKKVGLSIDSQVRGKWAGLVSSGDERAKCFLEALQQVDPENVESFYPIWLAALVGKYGWYRVGPNAKNLSFEELSKGFESTLSTCKEYIRETLGVVKYL